jgi:alpha-beta hydrolase superfamily lysophospholipase
MTLAEQHLTSPAWSEPAGLDPRGTLLVIPGRGEQPAVYERLARRLSADAYRVRVLHDPTSDAIADAREQYRRAPAAQLVSIAAGRHDALNDLTHRTVAATIVLFLERLRLGRDLPAIATSEQLQEES